MEIDMRQTDIANTIMMIMSLFISFVNKISYNYIILYIILKYLLLDVHYFFFIVN